MVLVLCDTYIKWEHAMHQRHLVATSETLLYAALEWNFYIMLLYTISGTGRLGTYHKKKICLSAKYQGQTNQGYADYNIFKGLYLENDTQ